MISRVWSGWARSDTADEYDRHYREEVLAELRRVPGFKGARLLRRAVGDETEFVSVTFFEDMDAVRAFAGDDYERANVAESARKVLSRYDLRAPLRHRGRGVTPRLSSSSGPGPPAPPKGLHGLPELCGAEPGAGPFLPRLRPAPARGPPARSSRWSSAT